MLSKWVMMPQMELTLSILKRYMTRQFSSLKKRITSVKLYYVIPVPGEKVNDTIPSQAEYHNISLID